MNKQIVLDGKIVGEDCPCYIIAEIGSNHNRDLDLAKEMIAVAKKCGCDTVKFQSYTADGLYSRYTPRISEMDGRSNPGETPYELIKRIQMPVEWHPELKAYCDKIGITFCSTPFDEKMVDILESIQIPYYKVASYEITHYPMLKKIALLGKPIILSTGNSDMKDIAIAVETLKKNGCNDFALLHCVSQYPAKYKDMNLRCIDTLREEFGCPVGFSDHTMDNISAVAAVALGACIVEKHITLDRNTFGPDHPFALEPQELRELVNSIRAVELALGSKDKAVQAIEEENHKIGRRSIVATVDFKKGDVISAGKIEIKRPSLGIHPKDMAKVLGRKVNKDIPKDLWITMEDLAD